MQRLWLAIRCFWAVLTDPGVALRARPLLAPPEPPPPPPPKPLPVGAVQVLAVLQREGRLLDFLKEDIGAYGDAQIGAAVRDIHRGCRRALDEHLPLAPVVAQPEDSPYDVPAGFDPAAVRLTGNVHGAPPFHGILKHHGWIVERFKLPETPDGSDPRVVAPAEVEVGPSHA